MRINDFEELEVWKKARELCKDIRAYSRKHEFSKDFKLCSQINAAAGSIMDNIAEGFEREGNKEFIQFLSIAKGSNGEVRSQAYRSFDSGFIDDAELSNILDKTKGIKIKLNALINYLKGSDRKGSKF